MKLRKYNHEAYFYILPIFVLFAVFIVYPIIFNIHTSFYKWNGMSANKVYVGCANYLGLFHDRVLGIIFTNFGIFGFLTIFIQAGLGLIFALMLRNLKFSNFYKTIIFMPVVVPVVVVGTVFSKIFEANMGLLNVFLRAVGLSALTQQWLADPKIAIYAIAAVNIWQWTGFSMILYFAGLAAVPDELYEAAKIDGAGKYKTFVKITLPLLRNTHYTLTILGAIGVLKTFDLVYILTNGGPYNATEFFGTYIFKKAFDLFDAGTSSALAIILFILAFIITLIQLFLYNRNGAEQEARL